MSNLKIQRIEVPELNIADYGSKINEQFNNIDINFQALANSDFFTGARGKGLKLIEVEPTSSNTFEFREDLEFHDESILEGDAGKALKNSIINAFKKYNKSNTTWYVGKKYVLYIDNNKKVHNVYPIIYTSETVGVDGNTSQDNSYLDFEYVNKVLTLTKSKGYPSLYYDSDEKKYCWLINGAKTGIVAQGKDGLDGQPGSGYDFDVLKVETEPLTNDGFYKISEVYWPKYFKWQKFDLDISSKDGNLNAGGSGYTATDIEWLSGGREQWINSYGSKTFIVPRTIIEYVEVEQGTGTHKKNDNGTYTPVSEGEPGDYIQKPVSVLHLCKLIKEPVLKITHEFDKVDTEPVGPGVKPVKPDESVIVVDDSTELSDPKTDTVVEEATSNNSEPALMTATITPNQTGPIIAIDKTTIGSMAPVFSTVVSDETKQKFTEAYDNNKKFVNEISTGKVTTIQYVTDDNKSVEVSMEGSLGSQIKASTAQYAVYVYGVYLTKENMHSLTSTISSGSTTGVSLAFDDINWASSNNSNLRCLYLKDCKEDAGPIPSSGILIYNSTLDADTSGTLNMRYVDNVTGYRFGSNDRPDPDKGDDKYNSLTLDLGNNGKLVTGTVEADTLNPQSLEVVGSTTTKDLNVGNNLNVTNSTTTKDLNVGNNLNVTNSTTTKDLTATNSTTTKDLTATNSTTTKDLTATNSIKSTSKTIQFVSYNVNTTFAPAVGGSGNIANTSSELERAEVVVDNNIIDNAVGTPAEELLIVPPGNNNGQDQDDYIKLGQMQLVKVPNILFMIINKLYSDKTINDIKLYNNTTWVGKDFELKIKLIKENEIDPDNYLYYHVTGYIECFNVDSFDDPHGFDPDSAYLNKLNIDTLVCTGITKSGDNVTHNNLSLRIYNDNEHKWGEKDLYALPYICVYPGKFDITLSKGRVNMSSINGPYLLDSYFASSGTVPAWYRAMYSSWYTTTYYDPLTQS